MDLITIGELVATVGVPSALVVFFVWISWKREERLSDRIALLENIAHTELREALANNTKAMICLKNALADVHEDVTNLHNEVKENTRVTHAIAKDLESRPCAIQNEKILQALGQLGGKVDDR